jgi:hypothetical protein
MAQNTIAVISDCDDTLAPDTTGQLLTHFGVAPRDVFSSAADLVKEGWDPTIAYMQCMIDLAKDRGPLGQLTLAEMEKVGRTLTFHKGVPAIFPELKAEIEGDPLFRDIGIRVETYVVSSGIEELLSASELDNTVHAIWGSSFAYEQGGGRIIAVKKSLSFTDKTRCIFLIQKGKVGADHRNNPYVVNEPMDPQERPVPFDNMIYIGDGASDIPCMSLIQRFGGIVIGILSNENPAKTWALGYGRRAHVMVPPIFARNEYGYNQLREALRDRANNIRRKLADHAPVPRYS